MIKPIVIKNLILDNNVFLAPLAGYTDVGMRHLAYSYGAGLTFTEMVSVKALLYGNKKTFQLTKFFDADKPKAIQLFGNNPDEFKNLISSGLLSDFDLIDINMGCPAPKIVKNKEGSFLLKDFSTAQKIIEACVSASTIPVSVKFRSGFDENENVAVEFAKMCESAGASMITIHARTTSQQYSGHSDWNIVKNVASAVNIPVIASGDVKTIDDVNYLTDVALASGVMIGRAAIGNPEIFAEIIDGKTFDKSIKLDNIKKLIKIDKLFLSSNYICSNLKKQLVHFLKPFKLDNQTLNSLISAKNLSEMQKSLKNIENNYK